MVRVGLPDSGELCIDAREVRPPELGDDCVDPPNDWVITESGNV